MDNVALLGIKKKNLKIQHTIYHILKSINLNIFYPTKNLSHNVTPMTHLNEPNGRKKKNNGK